MTTFTPAVLITGYDNRENPFAFWKSGDNWFDSYNERIAELEFIREHVFPRVRQAIIGPIVMTGAEWVEAGCPISLSDEQITAIEEATRLEARPLSEQVAEEVENDTAWLGNTASIRNHLPETNTNGNLQWQGVEFDMPAIVERTQAYSAGLKAQIDARKAEVKSLNSQAVKNVRLGGIR